MTTESNLLLIDGDNLLKRAYYGCGTSEFPPLHAFTSSLLRQMRSHMSGMCVVVWDGGHAKWRTDLLPGYKVRPVKPGHTDRAFDLRVLNDRAAALLRAFGVAQIKYDGIEADDVIAYLSKSCTRARIFSNDGDFLMLINNYTHVICPMKKGEYHSVRPSNFKKSTGFKTPDHLRMAKAISGDSSDCVEGIPGVGAKTALAIVESLTGDEMGYHAPGRGCEAVLRVCAGHSGRRWNRVSDNPKALNAALRCTDLKSNHLLDAPTIAATTELLVKKPPPPSWASVRDLLSRWNFPDRINSGLKKTLEDRPRRLPIESISFDFANDPIGKWGT